LDPKKPTATSPVPEQIEQALSHPINDFSISSIVKPGGIAGVLIDPMIPVPVQEHAIRIITEKLEQLGVTETRLFARKRSSNVGARLATDKVQIRVIDPMANEFSDIGKTSQGTNVALENDLLACDLRIAVGLITPHFVNSFTGGPDLIIPGASSLETIAKNRSLITKGITRPGSTEENAVLLDTFEAYKMSGPFFSLAIVPDGWDGVDSVFAGELESTYREAVSRYLQVHSPKLDRKADTVVVAAGKTLGMDLYHGVRVVSNAFGAVKKDGTIILVAECSNGIGDQTFLEFSRRFAEKRELVTELRHKFKIGSHVSLFLQDALEKYRIQLVSVLPDLYARDTFKLKPSRTASSAIQQAIRVEGKESKILLMTRGDLTIPIVVPPEQSN
jgi:nickel-dependent lactate racemase